MPGFARSLVLLVLLASLVTPVARAQSGVASAAVPLELIVKFSRDSETGRRIDGLISESPGDLSRLSDVQGRLLQATGVTLIPQRITSGHELIFRVPEEPLLEAVRKSLTAQQGIASAELVAIQTQNPRLPQSKLLVRFPTSTSESALLNKALADPAYHGQIRAWTLRLSASSDVPVLGSVDTADALTITVDRYALLEKLVGQLNALADVDYAQANSTVQFMK